MDSSADSSSFESVVFGCILHGRELLAIRQTDDRFAKALGRFPVSAMFPSFVVPFTLIIYCFLLELLATSAKSVPGIVSLDESVRPSVPIRVRSPLELFQLAIHVYASEVFLVEPLESVGCYSFPAAP
jgi:hypothetical protein